MPPRRLPGRILDGIAVVVVLAAVVRFVVLPRVGHPAIVAAPPVVLARVDGPPFDLAKQRGRVVFLDFWATWCDPCRASIPLVQHFKRTHPEAVVVSVDVGESPQLVAPFVKQFAMRDVALDPDERVSKSFGITGFPTMIVIDPGGTIRGRWPGYDPDVEKAMAEAQARWSAPRRTAARATR